MNELSIKVSELILQTQSIKMQLISPFTWGKGVYSPIYFDSRKLLSYPVARSFFKTELARLVKEQYPAVEAIAAVAPNSIALGVLVADELGLPFAYVHPKPKDHGLENMIEGQLKPKQKIVIVEDQVNLGANCTRVKATLENDGEEVLGMVTLLNFNLKDGLAKLKDKHLNCHSLTTLDVVMDGAVKMERLSTTDKIRLEKWQESPKDWKK